MSLLLGTLLTFGGLVGALLVWQMLPRDPVGPLMRKRRQVTGFQGQATEWLYWDAPLAAPRPKDLDKPLQGGATGVADRVLRALVARHAAEHQIPLKEAHERLVKETKAPHIKAFLQGRLRRAVRLHWQRQYTGPSSLFPVWFQLVLVVRHGRRHLTLEALTGIMKEMQQR